MIPENGGMIRGGNFDREIMDDSLDLNLGISMPTS